MSKKAISSLYKEQGVIHATLRVASMRPLERAKQVTGRSDPSKVFAMDPLLCIVDSRVSDAAFRVRSLVSACSWDGPCPLTYANIAAALDRSRSQTIRIMNTLIDGGYVLVQKGKNRANLYSVPQLAQARADGQAPDATTTPKPMKRAVTLRSCPKCHRERQKLRKTGLCGHCERDERTRRIAREEIAVAV